MPESHQLSRASYPPTDDRPLCFVVRRRRKGTNAALALATILALGAPPAAVLAAQTTAQNTAQVHPLSRRPASVAPTLEPAVGVLAKADAPHRAFKGSADGSDLANRIAGDSALRRTLLALRRQARTHHPTTAGTTAAASIVVGGSVADIPAVALTAYVRGAAEANAANPGCHIPWSLIAGIGRVESDHGQFGNSRPDAAGEVYPDILGPILDGTGGNAAITDTDGGRYDASTQWDRAVGPMQFIPSSWATGGRDGNGDGIADPENIFDAALSTGDYLCASGGDLRTGPASEQAVLSYNHSWDYVLVVVGYAGSYAGQDVSAITADIAAHLGSLAALDKAIAQALRDLARAAQLKAYFKAHAVHLRKAAHRPVPGPSPSARVTRGPVTPPATSTPVPVMPVPTVPPAPTASPSPIATASPTPLSTPTPQSTPQSTSTVQATPSPSVSP